MLKFPCWSSTYTVYSILLYVQSVYFRFKPDLIDNFLKKEMKTFKCSGCPHDIKMKKYWPITRYLTKNTLLVDNTPKFNAWSTPLVLTESQEKIETKPKMLDWRKDEKKVQMVKLMKENTDIFTNSIFIENIFPFLNKADLIDLKNVSLNWDFMIQEVLENMIEPLQCSITKELITDCTLGIHPGTLLLISSEMFDLISKSKTEEYLMKYQEFQKSNFIPLFDQSTAKLFKQNKDPKEVIQNICRLMLNLIETLTNFDIFFQDFFTCFISFHRWLIYLSEELQEEFQQKVETFMNDPESRKDIPNLVEFFCLIFVIDVDVDKFLGILLFEYYTRQISRRIIYFNTELVIFKLAGSVKILKFLHSEVKLNLDLKSVEQIYKKWNGNVPMKIRSSLNKTLSCSKWKSSTIKNLYKFLEIQVPESFDKQLEIVHKKYVEKSESSTRGRGRGRGHFNTRGNSRGSTRSRGRGK
jgi:hypothetical protein